MAKMESTSIPNKNYLVQKSQLTEGGLTIYRIILKETNEIIKSQTSSER